MRTLRSACLPISILSILLLSTLGFAAAPDRISGPVVARQMVRLQAGVSGKARPEFDQGRVDPAFRLGSITLLTVPSPSQRKSLDKLLADQQNPRSSSYHKWLTPEQYADRFGLSQNDIKKLTQWLQSEGFTVLRTARGRNWITFAGTAGQVETSFQTEIHRFNVNGETHFSNVSAPAIPAALSGIVAGFRGLNNFWPKSHALHAKPQYTLTQGSNSFLFLAPGDIATIYDVNALYGAGFDGTGQTLAVIGQTDVYLADLADFRSGFGLSAINCTTSPSNVITACNTPNFQYVLVNADPGSPSSGDLGEADIDIEWSGAVARNAQIIYVNAPDPSGGGVNESLYYAIDNNLAPVVTMSYGFCELDEALNGAFNADETEYKKANTQGITFLNSSGDSGAAECDFQTNLATGGYAVSYPASSPEVTGVGGTLIPFNEYTATYWSGTNGSDGGSALQYIPEVAWNDAQEWGAFCAGASGNCTGFPFSDWKTAQSVVGVVAAGGGLSNCATINGSGVCQSGIPRPTYQQGLSVPGQTASVRFSPDVALLASIYWPGFIVCTAQSEIGGGTSASSCAGGIPSAIAGCTGGAGLCSVFGGTSVASPIFAGMMSLLNHYLVQNGFQSTSGLGNANPALYQMAAYDPSAFHPIKSGSNGAFCSPGTPSNQPAALQCPSSGQNKGFLGFDASNFDSATGYNVVNGLGSVDAANLAVAWGNLLTPLTTFTITPSAAQIFRGQSETFTVGITPNTATGKATFSNGSTVLGSSTVTGGAAQFSTTALPTGTDNVTATYVGSFESSTTATPATVDVLTPDFTLTPTNATVSTAQGGTAGPDTITITSTNNFVTGGVTAMPLTYSCSGLPSESSCSFSPSASTTSATPSVSITTTAATALLHNPLDRSNRFFFALIFPGLMGIVLAASSRKQVRQRMRFIALIGALSLSVLWLTSCGGGGGGGGGGGNPGTPKGTYTITINATTGGSAPTTGSTSIQLTVN